MTVADSLVNSRAAWLGVEQRDRNDWIYHLSEAEKAELDSAIRSYRAAPRSLAEITLSNYPLPTPGSTIQVGE